MRENIELVGQVEVYLVNLDGSIAKHVITHNQITEAFARWLLFGNLAVHAKDTKFDRAHTGNGISHLLYSSPYQKSGAVTTEEPNLAQGYQIATADCGNDSPDPRFAIYALDCDVDINANTAYPPIFNPDLTTLNYDHLAFYSDKAQLDTGPYTFEFNVSGKRWSGVKSNPLFTTSYVKVSGRATVKSIVLAASHKPVDDTLPCVFVRQSPAEIPDHWETEKEALDPVYLIAPFIRSILIDSRTEVYRNREGVIAGIRYGDGVYGTGYTDTARPDNITFWDYGTGSFFTGDDGEARNPVTDEKFATLSTSFISEDMAGGYVLGGGKAIRVNPGESEFSSRGCIGRSVKFTTINKLHGLDMMKEFDGPMLYATEGTTIPDTINDFACPVMVAKRGKSSADDRIEVFVSLGVGTFTEYTDEHGYHPGGTGIEIHKLVIYIDHFRYTATTLEMVVNDNPEFLVNYGRVAVLPYAIGYLPGESKTTAETYLVGSYDVPWDTYYLPITHILSGVDSLDWSFSGEGITPILCASNRLQPGVVYHGCGWEFIRMCILGVDDTRLVYLSTNEGYYPIAVNRLRKWSTLTSQVLSGVSLPEVIEKAEDQRLIINYSYGFKVIDEIVGPGDMTITENLSNNRLIISVVPGSDKEYLSVYRGEYKTGICTTPVYGPVIPAVPVLSFEDGEEAKKYRYRVSSFNGAVNSDYIERQAWSPYHGASHAFMVLIDGGNIADVPAVKDQIIIDKRSGEVYLDERAGSWSERWYSTAEIKDGVLSEFDDYSVLEVAENDLEEVAQRYGTGTFVVCPDRRKMYVIYDHELIAFNWSNIKRYV